MKIFAISCLSLLAFMSPLATDARAENLFAPLNKVYDVDSKSNVFGVRRQGTGRMNTNLLSKIFNPDRKGVNQVPLRMLDGSQSTLQLRRQPANNVDGIQIVSGIVDGEGHNMATLVNDNGELRGRIWKNGKLFRLNGETNGEYRLSEISIAKMSNSSDTITPVLSEAQKNQNQQSMAAQGNLPPEDEPIDLLVLMTSKAIKDLGGREKAVAEMNLIIAETNNIYRQSGVTKSPMFRTVGVLALPWKENNNAAVDLKTWRSDIRILSIRNKLGADLVAFITAPDDYGSLCGVGYIGPGPDNAFTDPIPELGFSVSVLACMLTNMVFPHEIGHNLGARHDRHIDPGKGDNHGYVNLEKEWHTVMAYPHSCLEKLKKRCKALPYFSNPGIQYESDPIGIPGGQADSADNVTIIRRNKRIVASYKPRADAPSTNTSSSSVNKSSTSNDVRKVGGIILESATRSRQQAKPGNGKERVIKW